jgi:HD-GYP domain-containing protein (c-di-GMP phosphodiesterase class II)/FixJ family two-component response regulator
MRKKALNSSSKYKILVVDDEIGIIDSLSVVLKRSGYHFTGIIDPLEAVERVRSEHFDLMILDFLMYPIHGDKVVETIREFNSELYILLLTGHKDLAPPLETIRALDIQGYCEKSDRFDQLLLLVESGIKSISQMRTIKKFRDGLNEILQAVPKIYSLQPIDIILEDILTEIMPLVDSENAFILVDDTTDIIAGNKSIFKGIGKYKAEINTFMEMLSPSLMEHIGFARITRQVVKPEQGVILPLINEFQQAIGVIFVETSSFEDGLKLLEIYSNQAASSINNAFLHSLVNMKNDELNKTYDQLKLRYMDTIEALRQAVDAKDIYTRGHSDRVAYYSVRIGEEIGLVPQELETLRISGIFHDVGKIGTADDILLKTDRLNDRELQEIQKHPIKGARILSAVSMFKDVVPVVKCHHERLDGTGYPEGLKKDAIPLMARIISVADAFDAMMSDRLYRSKLNLEEAKQQLISGAGTQFDGEIVDVFIKLIDGTGYGEMLKETAATYE